ncbi:rhomboid protease [Babesia caballi]|uniref:Rhomboid protease n=1 Tax=Babesia caballi TaxID=5871 RepID=A0AAV4LU84_BABCB|nr:rhomboid protease [Babesia caballi]
MDPNDAPDGPIAGAPHESPPVECEGKKGKPTKEPKTKVVVNRRAPFNPLEHIRLLNFEKEDGEKKIVKGTDPMLEHNPLVGRLPFLFIINSVLVFVFLTEFVFNKLTFNGRCLSKVLYPTPGPRGASAPYVVELGYGACEYNLKTDAERTFGLGEEASDEGWPKERVKPLISTASDANWDAPNQRVFALLGGLNTNMIRNYGEYFRIFWSMFLHSSGKHLLFNVFCQIQALWIIEPARVPHVLQHRDTGRTEAVGDRKSQIIGLIVGLSSNVDNYCHMGGCLFGLLWGFATIKSVSSCDKCTLVERSLLSPIFAWILPKSWKAKLRLIITFKSKRVRCDANCARKPWRTQEGDRAGTKAGTGQRSQRVARTRHQKEVRPAGIAAVPHEAERVDHPVGEHLSNGGRTTRGTLINTVFLSNRALYTNYKPPGQYKWKGWQTCECCFVTNIERLFRNAADIPQQYHNRKLFWCFADVDSAKYYCGDNYGALDLRGKRPLRSRVGAGTRHPGVLTGRRTGASRLRHAGDKFNIMYTNVIRRWQLVRGQLQDRLASCKAAHSTRLLVVSKLQTPQVVEALFKAGQPAFAETDIQELHLKAKALAELPIRWRYLGHLQSEKVDTLLKIPNLSAIESLDSLKLANNLIDAIRASDAPERTLKVLCEINTALDDSNFGIDYRDYAAIEQLVRRVLSSGCLTFAGLMTVGDGSRACFSRLNVVKKQLISGVPECARLDAQNRFQMSMGTSEDWEHALDHDGVEGGGSDDRVANGERRVDVQDLAQEEDQVEVAEKGGVRGLHATGEPGGEKALDIVDCNRGAAAVLPRKLGVPEYGIRLYRGGVVHADDEPAGVKRRHLLAGLDDLRQNLVLLRGFANAQHEGVVLRVGDDAVPQQRHGSVGDHEGVQRRLAFRVGVKRAGHVRGHRVAGVVRGMRPLELDLRAVDHFLRGKVRLARQMRYDVANALEPQSLGDEVGDREKVVRQQLHVAQS